MGLKGAAVVEWLCLAEKKTALATLLKRVASWPQGARNEAEKALREIEEDFIIGRQIQCRPGLVAAPDPSACGLRRKPRGDRYRRGPAGAMLLL